MVKKMYKKIITLICSILFISTTAIGTVEKTDEPDYSCQYYPIMHSIEERGVHEKFTDLNENEGINHHFTNILKHRNTPFFIISIIKEYLSKTSINSNIKSMVNAPITPNDPLYEYQWSLENTGQTNGIENIDIDASKAWEITTGNEDITIAIIDSGIDFNHPDLIENIWINIDEVEENGVDDDRNGYIDDVHGYDFTNTDNDHIPFDRNGHGTLLAGRVAPATNNQIVLAGITWNCKIMPLQVIDDTSWVASIDHIIEAIFYAADNKADIICMTFEGTTSNQGFQEAINYATNKGVFICAAAGNSGTQLKRYPAAYDNVTSVAAINQWNERMEYTYQEVDISIASNYGNWVDVAAPGQEIYSTMPTYHVPLNDVYLLDQDYSIATGCCITTPLVAGVAALVLSEDRTLSPSELAFIIRATTEPVDSSYYLGTGCINAYNALIYDNKPETPNGPNSGKVGEEYTYTTIIDYANDEPLYYLWDFGDGIQHDWIGPIASNEPCVQTYVWDKEGTYHIRVKVKDEVGGESQWSNTLQISMPKNNIINSLNKSTEYYSILFKMSKE